MNKKNIIVSVAVAVVFAGVGFFGGMKYGQTPKALASLSQTQRQALAANFRGLSGGLGGRRAMGSGTSGGFTSGQIMAKDDKSITVKMQNGSSRIVFIGASTQIAKSVAGAAADLSQGANVVVNGTANSDGTVTAQSIQIRPDAAPVGN
jgi:hypothetical protein